MSSVIVDTHIVIWDQLDPTRLTGKARKAIARADADHKIIICEITLWEISILIKKRRLIIDRTYLDFMDQVFNTKNYLLQGITPHIAFFASELEIDTKDPADRLIAATSIVLGLPLVTSDQVMRQSIEVKTIW